MCNCDKIKIGSLISMAESNLGMSSFNTPTFVALSFRKRLNKLQNIGKYEVTCKVTVTLRLCTHYFTFFENVYMRCSMTRF